MTAPPLPLTLRALDEVVRRSDPVGDRILLRRVAWTAALCDMPDVRVALRLPERGDVLTFVRSEPSLGNITGRSLTFSNRRAAPSGRRDTRSRSSTHARRSGVGLPGCSRSVGGRTRDSSRVWSWQAAVYYSNLHGVVSLKHAGAFVLEVALGALFGVVFAASWATYRTSKVRMDQVPATSLGEVRAKAPLFLRARGWLAWNLALLAGIVGIMFYAANWLLRHDIWINPIPLVVGMSLKGLLASRHLDAEHEVRDWWTFLNRHPDVVWQVPVIVASVCLAWYWRH